MSRRAHAIVQEVARERHVALDLLLGACRVERVYRARIEVAVRMRDELHYSMPQIGRLLNKDHTTICFYLGAGKRKPRRPKWHRPLIEELRIRRPPQPKAVKAAKPRRLYLVPYAGADWTEYQWKPRPNSGA